METIWLQAGGEMLVIKGGTAEAVWGEVRRQAVRGERENPRVVLDFAMRGSAAELQAALNGLTRMAALAEREGGWLMVIPEGTEETWRTRVIAMQVEVLGSPVGERLTGSLGVRLMVERDPFWEGEEIALPLTNQHGTAVETGLRLDNHADIAHNNFADVGSADVGGGLMSPLLLEVLPEPAVPGVVGELSFGWWQGADVQPFNHVLEGEAAVTGLTTSLVSASDASGGYLRTVSWSSAANTELMSWTLTGANLDAGGGRVFRPLLRLGAGWLGDEMWLSLVLTSSQSGLPPLWQSTEVVLEAGQALVRFPPLNLPPWQPSAPPAPMNLALVGLAPAGGSQTLSVDFLQLFPHDNGMRVCPAALMPDGTHVMVDSGNQLAGALLPTGELRLPMVEGNGLWLLPGTAHRLYLLQGSGDFPGVGAAVRVKASYRPRVWDV